MASICSSKVQPPWPCRRWGGLDPRQRRTLRRLPAVPVIVFVAEFASVQDEAAHDLHLVWAPPARPRQVVDGPPAQGFGAAQGKIAPMTRAAYPVADDFPDGHRVWTPRRSVGRKRQPLP